MKFLPTVLGAASFLPLAWAHGYVDNATIGGQFYQFYQPYSDPYYSTPVSIPPFLCPPWLSCPHQSLTTLSPNVSPAPSPATDQFRT